jgi:hypothetical protein
MDCQTALQMIEMHPHEVSGWRSVDRDAVQEHLATCALCQSAAAEIHEWDSRLQAVMTAVPVPEGVRERLLSQLSKSAPEVTSGVKLRTPARRYLKWSVAGLSLSLAVAVGMVFWWNAPSQMLTAEVGAAAADQLRSRPFHQQSAFDDSFAAEIADDQWRNLCTAQPVGLDIDHRAGHDVAAYAVNIPQMRFRGWLVVIPVSRISDVPESTVPVSVAYSQMASWSDGKSVFVCVADQGSLDKLLKRFSGAAA